MSEFNCKRLQEDFPEYKVHDVTAKLTTEKFKLINDIASKYPKHLWFADISKNSEIQLSIHKAEKSMGTYFMYNYSYVIWSATAISFYPVHNLYSKQKIKLWLEKGIEQSEECPICYEKYDVLNYITPITCDNCMEPICTQCMVKLDECPFCRDVLDVNVRIINKKKIDSIQ